MPGEYTFYGRYAAVAGQDQREPLADIFAARYINGGLFNGGTDLIVWRDSKTVPTGANGPHSCAGNPAWFPLSQTRVSLAGGNVIGADPSPPANFGWILLNLDTSVTGISYPVADPTIAQAWITTIMKAGGSAGFNKAEGRFSVGYDAVKIRSVHKRPSG